MRNGPRRVAAQADLPVGECHVVELARRRAASLDLTGELEQFLAHLLAGGLDRRSDRGRRERSALDRRFGQRRIAELERHVLDRQSERLGGDLGHDRVGAGADVRRRAADRELAVGGQHCLGGRC